MTDKEAILTEVRRNYGVIYRWHKEYGCRSYKEKHGDERAHTSPWFHKYVNLLERMPSPKTADLAQIVAVAGEVLWGCMEWSYWEEVEPGLPLNKIAHRIQKLVRGAEEELDEEEAAEAPADVLKKLQNVGQGARGSPLVVEIKVPPDHLTLQGYTHFASIAYADVSHHAQANNVGGAVALADTNLEHEQRHGRNTSGKSSLRFRNAKAMHFTESEGAGTIAALARDRTISVLSIKIGG